MSRGVEHVDDSILRTTNDTATLQQLNLIQTPTRPVLRRGIRFLPIVRGQVAKRHAEYATLA